MVYILILIMFYLFHIMHTAYLLFVALLVRQQCRNMEHNLHVPPHGKHRVRARRVVCVHI